MLSYQDYFKLNLEHLAQQPPEVQRKYPRLMAEIEGRDPSEVQPRRRQARRTPNTATSELHDETGIQTNFGLVAQASRALARISTDRADRYETWVAVGMALSELGRLGFVFWEEWSRRSSKFEPGACSEKWPTFTPGDGLTIRHLDIWANEDDPRDTPTDGCTADCTNRARVAAHQATIRKLEQEIDELRTRNRFVTDAQSSKNIKSASMRDTVVELKKELDRVPLEERLPDQFVRVRPSYMAAFANSSPSTVGRHLKRMEDHGFIERKIERSFDPEKEAWVSETFVRPLVDLTDPSVLVIPSEHGGDRRQRCTKCNSDKLVREIKVYCAECEGIQSQDIELVNAPEEATVAPEVNDGSPLDCILRDKEILASNIQVPADLTGSSLFDLQDAIQPEPPRFVFGSQSKAAKPSAQPPTSPLDVSDPSKLPGVRSGTIAADDPWITYQQGLAAKRAQP